jgi:hypothetical protein
VRSDKTGSGTPPREADGKDGKQAPDLGDALRRAYDEAVSEQVPDDLLDLLKKLD